MASTNPPSCPVAASPLPTAADSNSNPHEEATALPPRGVYHPPRATDTRGPCPMLNTLANHGYIPRSGRGIQAREITSALHDVVGVSWAVAVLFTHPIFFVHHDPPEVSEKWWKSWSGIRRMVFDRPLIGLILRWGMRQPGQYLDVDEAGSGGKGRTRRRAKVINLDQLGTANAIEHDISLTRRDRGQTPGRCMRKQLDLVEGLLNFRSPDSPLAAPDDRGEQGDVEAQRTAAAGSASSSSPLLTLQDLAGYRCHRIKQQREEAAASSRKIQYGEMEHSFACMEIALFLGVFGLPEEKFKKVPRAYARAFFKEERLPFEEGWVARGTAKQTGRGWRSWWKCRRNSRRLGWFELIRTSGRVRKVIGKI